MDRILASLTFPSKYKHLIKLENVVCGIVIEHLRVLQSDKLDIWVKESLQYLDSQKTIKNPTRFHHICLGISCLYFYFLNNITPLEPYINYLYSSDDPLSMQFCAHTIAKVAGALPPAEDGFPQHQLDFAFANIKYVDSKDDNSILFGLYLLHDLAMSIPLLFLLHSADLPEQLWPWLIDRSSDIRSAASQVLYQYLVVLMKYQGFKLHENFDQIVNNAISHLLKSPSDCPQGALTVIELVLEIKPDFFVTRVQSIYEATNQILKTLDHNSSRHETKTIAFRVIASLSALNPAFFEQESFHDFFVRFTSGNVWSKLLPSAFDALVVLIQNIPQQFKQSDLLKNIYSICLLASQREQILKQKVVFIKL